MRGDSAVRIAERQLTGETAAAEIAGKIVERDVVAVEFDGPAHLTCSKPWRKQGARRLDCDLPLHTGKRAAREWAGRPKPRAAADRWHADRCRDQCPCIDAVGIDLAA